LIEAIDQKEKSSIKEEIGDILFLGIFLALVFEQEKGISFDRLITATVKKYRDKHPHVYEAKRLKTSDEVLQYWQKSKNDIFEGIPLTLPALLAAKIIQERTAKTGFDWDSYRGPLKKVIEELHEIRSATNKKKIFEELGDLLFACVNLARHLQVDPEDALRFANKKFVRRFRVVKSRIEKKGKQLHEAGLKEMDSIWNQVKR